MSRFKKGRYDTMRQACINTEISPKAEGRETVPTGLQSMHGQEGGKFDEKKNMKLKPMHKHFIHAQSYITRHTASDTCFPI